MIVNNVSLEAVAVKKEQYPATGMPEVAFAGKSNVGKSSLINCMINRIGAHKPEPRQNAHHKFL